jgi:hypothetical protein
MPIVDELPGAATFTLRTTATRADLVSTAERQARRAGELLADWPGAVAPGGPGFLLLPEPDGDPVEIESGVPAEYEPSSVPPELRAGFRPCGPVVRFPELAGAREWLADNGFDSAGQPWLTFPDREVVWPVRPVRDTETFIGRHGPRRDLDRARENRSDSTETVGQVLDMLRTGASGPRMLSGLHSDAMAAAQYTQLISPGDPEVARYLRLAARAEVADKVRRTTPVTVDLEGPVSLDSGTGTAIGKAFVDAVMLAVALHDEVSLDLLRTFSLDTHLEVHGRRPPEFVATQARAMLAVATNDRDAREKLAAVLQQAEAMAELDGVGPWYTHMEVPIWRLALGKGSARDALVAHRTWWGTWQPNPGDRQDLSPEGYLSVGVLCFGDGTVRSEYLP